MKVPQILNEVMKDNFKCILLIGEQIESVVIKDRENNVFLLLNFDKSNLHFLYPQLRKGPNKSQTLQKLLKSIKNSQIIVHTDCPCTEDILTVSLHDKQGEGIKLIVSNKPLNNTASFNIVK